MGKGSLHLFTVAPPLSLERKAAPLPTGPLALFGGKESVLGVHSGSERPRRQRSPAFHRRAPTWIPLARPGVATLEA
jgi:hypothetical protein